MTSIPKPKLHIAMFPYLALGHITPYINLAKELAKEGHQISFLLPKKTLGHFSAKNPYPHLLKFYPLNMPKVDGLPVGAETNSDIDITVSTNALDVAIDAMSVQVEALLYDLKPNIVFYDFALWIPNLAAKIGFKTVCYHVICASFLAMGTVPARHFPKERSLTIEELMETPKGYPSSTVVLRYQEARKLSLMVTNTFDIRLTSAMQGADAIGIRTCRELEGPMCDYIQTQFNKPVFLSGPFLPKTLHKLMETKWEEWLSKFNPKSFQELVLGFEMTGLPFFVALSKPKGANSIEEALPEGFAERVGDRGVVYGGWVEQTKILNHSSVGCFVSHCGFGSMWESLLSDTQIVLVPWLADQILNTRLLVEELEVAVEVERGEMGWVSKENLCKAIKFAMDEESEVGKVIKQNHANYKEILAGPKFMDNYVHNFIASLYGLL
ncbi:hypothetical protein ACJIZ3_019859 [Penstemon smallii]|uniref:Glycosyltransferase n=1 Tax=Penstemon smallii TaxID=265156 RepID=A0ABD3T2J6_9LAMI